MAIMWRLLLVLFAVVALSTTVALIARAEVVSAGSYVPVIVPNVGLGGLKLGESLSDVHKQLGGSGPVSTGIANSGEGESWLWGRFAPTDPAGPLVGLTVEYAYVNGKPGPVSLLGTGSPWALAGTTIVSIKHGNLAALRRYYGKRLLGPYVVGPPTGKDGSSAVYYELPGRYLGRRVHTLFETTTYRPLADEFLAVSVSFCVKTALFRSALDIPCHAA
jgi:hypothetical protein